MPPVTGDSADFSVDLGEAMAAGVIAVAKAFPSTALRGRYGTRERAKQKDGRRVGVGSEAERPTLTRHFIARSARYTLL